MRKGLIIGAALVLAAALLAGCESTETKAIPMAPAQKGSSSSPMGATSKAKVEQLQSLLTKAPSTKESGAVSVEAMLNPPELLQALSLWEAEQTKGDPKSILQAYQKRYDLDQALVFTINMNTHSVDLDRFRVETLALLRTDQGKEYPATRWEEAQDSGGHHRSGKLLFSKLDIEPKEILGSAKYLELVIQDLAGVKERAYRWELPITYPSGL